MNETQSTNTHNSSQNTKQQTQTLKHAIQTWQFMFRNHNNTWQKCDAQQNPLDKTWTITYAPENAATMADIHQRTVPSTFVSILSETLIGTKYKNPTKNPTYPPTPPNPSTKNPTNPPTPPNPSTKNPTNPPNPQSKNPNPPNIQINPPNPQSKSPNPPNIQINPSPHNIQNTNSTQTNNEIIPNTDEYKN
eukprot:409858_1